VLGSVLRAPMSTHLLTRFGMERGLTEQRCLRRTGLRLADLNRPEQHVTAEQELTVIANLLAALGDRPGLGLEAGLRYHLTTYGIWGFALVSSPTLRSAISVGLRYLDLTFTFCRVSAREEGGDLCLTLDASAVPAGLRRFLIERDMAATHVIQRELFGTATRLRRVSFAFPAPPCGVRRYEDVFGFCPDFGAAEHMVAFDGSRLDMPLPQAEPSTADLAAAQCRRLLEQRRGRAGLAGQVQNVLLSRPGMPPALPEVAGELHMSPRTLRRRLAAEGASYRTLLDEMRAQLAEELLVNGRLTVQEVAQRLGYAETSSFTHAFRRWNGVGPRAHRRACADSR
jgi:AraC-like DNA-binding protein